MLRILENLVLFAVYSGSSPEKNCKLKYVTKSYYITLNGKLLLFPQIIIQV